LIFQIADLMH